MKREILVVWAGRHRRDHWEALCAEYRRRIAPLAAIRDVPVKMVAAGDEPGRRAAEGEALLAALPTPCRVVALDRRGTALSSDALAAELGRLIDTWPYPVAYLVGSDLGLEPRLVARADQRWSLGPLTLPHQLARLVVYEQLYRALSIRAGIKYHRQPF